MFSGSLLIVVNPYISVLAQLPQLEWFVYCLFLLTWATHRGRRCTCPYQKFWLVEYSYIILHSEFSCDVIFEKCYLPPTLFWRMRVGSWGRLFTGPYGNSQKSAVYWYYKVNLAVRWLLRIFAWHRRDFCWGEQGVEADFSHAHSIPALWNMFIHV